GTIGEIQFGIQLGALAQDRTALIAAVYGANKYKSLRDLARASDDLPALVSTIPDEQLEDTHGATLEEKHRNYSKQLQAILEKTYPTDAVARIAAADASAVNDIR